MMEMVCWRKPMPVRNEDEKKPNEPEELRIGLEIKINEWTLIKNKTE